MNEVITGINNSPGQSNRYIGIYLQYPVHGLSYYSNLPLDSATETNIVAELFKFLWSSRSK